MSDANATAPESADTPEMKAYRRGKAAGYSIGLVAGWDACVRHIKACFYEALNDALKEPEAVVRHREAARLEQQRKETDQ
jgi:hypothetical protein